MVVWAEVPEKVLVAGLSQVAAILEDIPVEGSVGSFPSHSFSSGEILLEGLGDFSVSSL